MSCTQKIEKAKTRLVVKHPWFGLLASRLKTEPDDETETFLSDGKTLHYNTEWLSSESVETAEFMLANSVMHHVLAHENRQKGRQGRLWQLATDYAINDMLAENGFKLPQKARYDPRFAGKYAEEIYALLKEEFKHEEYSDDENAETVPENRNRNRTKERHFRLDPYRPTTDRPQLPQECGPELEQVWSGAARQALERARKLGDRTVGMQRFFKRQNSSSVDWRGELYQAISRHHKNDYTFARPAKKWVASNLYLPATHSEKLLLAVAIDTSGSINQDLLERFIDELEAILLSFPDTEVDLLLCDAKITGIYRFVTAQTVDFPVKGGGGTDFRPVFEYIETNLPQTSLLIYFTDGKGRFPDREPTYEILWAMPHEAPIPFGRTILIHDTH